MTLRSTALLQERSSRRTTQTGAKGAVDRLQISQAEASHRLGVGSIPSGETQLVFDRGCCDEGVGKKDAARAMDPAGAFGHRAISVSPGRAQAVC